MKPLKTAPQFLEHHVMWTLWLNDCDINDLLKAMRAYAKYQVGRKKDSIYIKEMTEELYEEIYQEVINNVEFQYGIKNNIK